MIKRKQYYSTESWLPGDELNQKELLTEISSAKIKSFAKVNEGALIKAVAADNQVEDVQVLHAMKRHGGGFVKALAEAGLLADSVNFQKLKAAWPDCWAEHAAFARADQQREAEFAAVRNAVERCGCGSPAGTLKPCVREPDNARFTCNCCDACREQCKNDSDTYSLCQSTT